MQSICTVECLVIYNMINNGARNIQLGPFGPSRITQTRLVYEKDDRGYPATRYARQNWTSLFGFQAWTTGTPSQEA